MTSDDIMTDRDEVRAQYATEGNLLTRQSVWQPAEDGRAPPEIALAVARASAPADILEIGCGTGAFAARIAQARPGATLLATDQSPRFVELTAARGVRRFPFGRTGTPSSAACRTRARSW